MPINSASVGKRRDFCFFLLMSNCFHASVVMVDCISFQVQYFKRSQAVAVETLLNAVLGKKNCSPPQKFLRTPKTAIASEKFASATLTCKKNYCFRLAFLALVNKYPIFFVEVLKILIL